MGNWELRKTLIRDNVDGGCTVSFEIIGTAGVLQDGETMLLKQENERLKEEIESWRRVAERLEREKQALKGGE